MFVAIAANITLFLELYKNIKIVEILEKSCWMSLNVLEHIHKKYIPSLIFTKPYYHSFSLLAIYPQAGFKLGILAWVIDWTMKQPPWPLNHHKWFLSG